MSIQDLIYRTRKIEGSKIVEAQDVAVMIREGFFLSKIFKDFL